MNKAPALQQQQAGRETATKQPSHGHNRRIKMAGAGPRQYPAGRTSLVWGLMPPGKGHTELGLRIGRCRRWEAPAKSKREKLFQRYIKGTLLKLSR